MLALAEDEPRSSSPLPLAAIPSPVSVSWPGTGYGNKAFTGREWDPETNLYYYRARYYDPKIGRFISEDPLGYHSDDHNLYRYVRNAPVRLIDPSGQQAAAAPLMWTPVAAPLIWSPDPYTKIVLIVLACGALVYAVVTTLGPDRCTKVRADCRANATANTGKTSGALFDKWYEQCCRRNGCSPWD